jgi:hypothetical protein
MKKSVFIIFLVTCGFLTVEKAFPQKSLPVKAGFAAEQISLPTFQYYGSGFGYGFTIGTEFAYKTNEKTDLLQTADFHFISHQQYGSSFILSSLFDVRLKPGKFNIDFKIGPGYLLFHNYSPVYKQADGTYESASQLQSKFIGMLSLSFAYQIGQIKPYLAYTACLETPFINGNSPIIPHQMFEIGIVYDLNFTKNEE